MKYKINVFCVGRAHRGWLNDSINLYEKRLLGNCILKWIIVKSNNELKAKINGINYYCFDLTGKQYSSEDFSKFLEGQVSWNFVIGGACGIPASILDKSKGVLSLSKLTFTHEMVRLLLAEQFYRALEIIKGSAYHK